MENNTSLSQDIAELIYGTYYRWSFTARLHQAPDDVAGFYNDIKNAFLKYKRVHSRISWGCDTISYGKEQLAKLVLTQKTLYVYLALSPKELEGSKYFFTDESDTKKYERVPLRVRVRSERGVRYTIELIEMIAELKGLQPAKNFEVADYTLPHESVEVLLDRQLIKRIELTEQAPTPDEPETDEPAPENPEISFDKQSLSALVSGGSIFKYHDPNTQVYSNTMGDYRVHLGIDVATALNSEVYALYDGTVSKIWEDSMMGHCLAIDHGHGLISIYKNLSGSYPAGIEVGATITAGQAVGYVGDSAMIEIADEPHLHFEMSLNGDTANPLDYLNE